MAANMKQKQIGKVNQLLDNFDFTKDNNIENVKIFSSTAVDEKAETESFSLRLSDSFVDETPDSDISNSFEKNPNEVIIIDDSSSEAESIFSKPGALLSKICEKYQIPKEMIEEPVKDKECNTAMKYNPIKRSENIKLIAATTHTAKNIIEESISELDESRLPEHFKDSIADTNLLSERKKKEILQWLLTKCDNSKFGSSSSQDSAIPESRHSGASSGNSSLERFEALFETPNNRDKFSNLKINQKSNSAKSVGKQTTIDQYFNKTKSQIFQNKTPTSKHSTPAHITPANSNHKIIASRLVLADSDSINSKASTSTESDETSILVQNKKKIIIPESLSSDTSRSKTSENKLAIPNRKKLLLTDSLDSRTPSSKSSIRTPIEIIKSNTRKIIISESESNESNSHDLFSRTSSAENPQKNVISEKERNLNVQDLELLHCENVDITQDLSDEVCERDKNKCNNKPTNMSVNDCADILEKLYGAPWRNKASELISATEPKKRVMNKFFNVPDTEKKIDNIKTKYGFRNDDWLSKKKIDKNIPIKLIPLSTKQAKPKKIKDDSFINDDSTTESSPDCSFYTAVSHPISSQVDRFKVGAASTVKINDKNGQNKLRIVDSESDDDYWKHRKNNQRKLTFDSSSSSETSEYDPEDIIPPKLTGKTKNVAFFKGEKVKCLKKIEKQSSRKSFLASLSNDVPLENADFRAMAYRVKYNTLKEKLCLELYKLFNEKVFENQLPEDMLIEWSVRLRGTAGKCYNKQSLKAFGKIVRSSRIVLATKILDSPDRLRDTLIHEMCHAATWLINGISDGHGAFWKSWACKAIKAFPDLPPISRCHNYDIQTKYTYKCKSCGYSVGRHSKSLDLNTKRCGYCHGSFELLINKITKDGKVQKSAAQTKELSGFALFVKENYRSVKEASGPSKKHAELMKILGQQFSAIKLNPKQQN